MVSRGVLNRSMKDVKTTITEKSEELREKHPVLKTLRAVFLCTVGAFAIAFVLNTFVSTGGLFPGGFAGLALLITRSADKFLGVALPYSAIYLPLNIIPIAIGIRFLGKKFTAYSMYVIILSSIIVDVLPKYVLTYDILLISLFGGILNGAAISVCLYAGACGGGSDFISIFFAEKKGIDCWNYILMANVVILGIAGAVFGWDKALYSIVYQFCTTEAIKTLFHRYHTHTLIIVTDLPEAVYDKISIISGHDATHWKGTGFYGDQKKNVIYSVVESDQVDRVVKEIKDIDPHAFINVLRTEQLEGRFYRSPNE